MSSRDDDIAEIAWPGFVDILSAVIMMFVFFVMILSIVMFVLSINHQQMIERDNVQKIREGIENIKSQILAKNQLTPEEFEIQIQKINELQELSQENNKLNKKIAQLKADLAKSNEQNVIVAQDSSSLTVVYKKNDVTLTEITESMIADFLGNMDKETRQKVRIVIEAGDNPETKSLSVSREIALARTLNVRNVILEGGIAAPRVSVAYKDPEKIEDSYHWVRIKIDVPKP